MKSKKFDNAMQRRKFRVRKKIFGRPDRPRLTIFRSNKNIYAQIIDDTAGVTLVSASSQSKTLRDQIGFGGNCKAAAVVGEAVAKQAKSVGINQVSFDRGCYKYHGRVKTLADAARKGGLDF